MTIENPYVPPNYGTRHLAVERRIAEQEEKPAPKKSKKKDD